ncbi:glycosyltransferase family 2 protein [Algoriphagus namhaensis]|uniref:Glycosyltransferase family 2 protein n=1 Tax=Algoriphagus namhaensis TaxID=915353 RepID=A0ABV8AVD6_9BACT
MSSPKFSVIIPCFNQGHFLKQTIKSLLDQSFWDWEAIIVDDGSTDNSGKLAEEIVAGESRAQVIHQLNNGLSAARNTGIGHAKGEFLVFLDSDDWLYPEYFKTVNSYLSEDLDILITGYAHWKDGLCLQSVSKPKIRLSLEDFMSGNYGPVMTFSVRKNIFDEIGCFDETLKSGEDWDLWIRAMKAGRRAKAISEILAAYRFQEQSMSRDALRMYRELEIVLNRVPENDLRINSKIQVLPQRFDFSQGILNILFPTIGVLIVQGKVSEAIHLYEKEQRRLELVPTKEDFVKINSYLTFRYWSTTDEIQRVFLEIKPRVISFLEANIKDDNYRKIVVKRMFFTTEQKYNHLKFGVFFGCIINAFYK